MIEKRKSNKIRPATLGLLSILSVCIFAPPATLSAQPIGSSISDVARKLASSDPWERESALRDIKQAGGDAGSYLPLATELLGGGDLMRRYELAKILWDAAPSCDLNPSGMTARASALIDNGYQSVTGTIRAGKDAVVGGVTSAGNQVLDGIDAGIQRGKSYLPGLTRPGPLRGKRDLLAQHMAEATEWRGLRKMEAIDSFGRYPERLDEFRPILADSILDSDSAIRMTVLDTVGSLGSWGAADDGLFQIVAQGLADPEVQVRTTAARAASRFGIHGETALVAPLLHSLTERSILHQVLDEDPAALEFMDAERSALAKVAVSDRSVSKLAVALAENNPAASKIIYDRLIAIGTPAALAVAGEYSEGGWAAAGELGAEHWIYHHLFSIGIVATMIYCIWRLGGLFRRKKRYRDYTFSGD